MARIGLAKLGTLAFAIAMIGSCGGSGGNANTEPPVLLPPPPANVPPVAEAQADKSAVDEGQSFTLDASGSSDADGDALTFEWMQISGPSVEIADPSQATLDLIAPEVTSDERLTFEIQVRDGESTTSATADVDIVNIEQTPLSTTRLSEVSDIYTDAAIYSWEFFDTATQAFPPLNGFYFFGRIGTAETPDSAVSYNFLLRNEATNEIVTKAYFPDMFDRPHFLGADTATVSETAQNRITFYEPDEQNELIQKGRLELEQPCLVTFAEVFLSRSEYYYVVPQKNGSVSIFVSNLLFSEYPGAADFTLVQSINADACGPSWGSLFFDTDKNQLTNIQYSETSAEFEVSATSTLNVVSENPSLEYVDHLIVGDRTSKATSGMLILLSDGRHRGDHRLIYARFDEDTQEIVQSEIAAWDLGIPEALYADDRTTLDPRHIWILSSSVPQIRTYTLPAQKTLTSSDLMGPEFIEVGLGVYDIQYQALGFDGFLLNFRDDNRAVLFERQ